MPLPPQLPLSPEQELVPYVGLKPIQFEGVHGLSFMRLAEVEFLSTRLHETGGNLLEIGSAAGATVAALLHACLEARATCVDKFYSFTEDPVNNSGEAHLTAWFRNCLAVGRRMSLSIDDFMRAISASQFSQFNLILLDADHSFASVALDLLNLWRLASESRTTTNRYSYVVPVTKDPVLILHDYGAPAWPGVAEAVDMLCLPRVYPFGESDILCEAFFRKVTVCESLVELQFRDTDRISASEWYAAVQHIKRLSEKAVEDTADANDAVVE